MLSGRPDSTRKLPVERRSALDFAVDKMIVSPFMFVYACLDAIFSFERRIDRMTLVPWIISFGGLGAIAGRVFGATSGGLQIGMFVGFCLGIAAPHILEARAKKAARRATRLARREMDRSKRKKRKNNRHS
jgi:hypothetical protein